MSFEPTPSAISHTQTADTGLSGAATKTSRDAGTTDMTTTDTQTTDDLKEGSNRSKDKGVNVAVKVNVFCFGCSFAC